MLLSRSPPPITPAAVDAAAPRNDPPEPKAGPMPGAATGLRLQLLDPRIGPLERWLKPEKRSRQGSILLANRRRSACFTAHIRSTVRRPASVWPAATSAAARRHAVD